MKDLLPELKKIRMSPRRKLVMRLRMLRSRKRFPNLLIMLLKRQNLKLLIQ